MRPARWTHLYTASGASCSARTTSSMISGSISGSSPWSRSPCACVTACLPTSSRRAACGRAGPAVGATSPRGPGWSSGLQAATAPGARPAAGNAGAR